MKNKSWKITLQGNWHQGSRAWRKLQGFCPYLCWGNPWNKHFWDQYWASGAPKWGYCWFTYKHAWGLFHCQTRSTQSFRSSSSHIFTIPESTNFFHEIFFVLFFYSVEVFYWDQKFQKNLFIITEKYSLQPSKKIEKWDFVKKKSYN